MARRRGSPLDVPPVVSSSDEEGETSSEEEQTSEDGQVQASAKPTVLSPNTKKTDDDSESDAESSSESEPDDSTVKPIASKPMVEKKGARSKPSVAATPEKKSAAKRPRESETTAMDSKKPMAEKKGARSKPSVAATPEKKSAAKRPRESETTAMDSKKPMEEKKGARSKPSVAATPEKKSAAKRPRESETTAMDSKKRMKKKSGPEVPPPEADGDGGAASDEEQKDSKKSGGNDSRKLFQRLWSEDDEIVILKGLMDYAAKRGGDPAATDMNAFHDFIKKSVHVVVTKAQLSDKVRRLKKKYSNNSERKKYNPKKPHEQNVFELSKKIWGGGGSHAGISSPKSNGAAKSNGKATLASPAAPKEPLIRVGGESSVSVRSSEMIRFGMKSLPEEVVKKGLDLLPASKKAELDAMWKKLRIDDLELFVEKNQLMNELAKLVVEKLKSSDH